MQAPRRQEKRKKVFVRACGFFGTVLRSCWPLPPFPSPLLYPHPSQCLSLCASGASAASSRQKANEREKKIHYGLVLPCSSQPFSPVWTSGLCFILMLQRDGGEALLSLGLSALKTNEGRENEYVKKMETI